MKPTAVKKAVKKRVSAILVSRVTICLFFIVLQLAILGFLLWKLADRSPIFYSIAEALTGAILLWLLRKEDNPAYKIPWIIIMLVFPLFGVAFYLVWGNTPMNRRRLAQIRPIDMAQMEILQPSATAELCQEYPQFRRNCQYLHRIAEMPAWEHTTCRYFPSGEALFEALLPDLRSAKRFIFIEYFIIERGIMWDPVYEILKEKAVQGVDVRVMYDDVGSLGTLPLHYDRTLRQAGIQALKFNQLIPLLNTYLNFRDHRKICVIDGNIGYTGGINLADEYINAKERFGHWKDTGVRLEGEGVFNLTTLFLQLWDYSQQQETKNLKDYMPTVSMDTDGYVQAFADSPLDTYNVSETVFMNIIAQAQHSVYITSPYLVLDNEMITALCTAAESGIDVRIVTPGIPDKQTVFCVTRSYYGQLLRSGVKIYEYTPGFMHSKMIVADNEVAVVGTINMDFRSFYLHFENGVVFYHSLVVQDVQEDILHSIDVSQEITLEWLSKTPWIVSIWSSILRLFSPLL